MAINFPSAPSMSQEFTDASNITYVWTGYSWAIKAASGGGVSIGDVPPAAPGAGNMWWESDTGILWIYYNDGNTSQWVQAAGTTGVQGVGSTDEFVMKAGDTMTGSLVLSGATYATTLTLLNTTDNMSKVVRMGPSGTLEIVNNANTAAVMTVTDAGDASVRGEFRVGTASLAGAVRFGTSNTAYLQFDGSVFNVQGGNIYTYSPWVVIGSGLPESSQISLGFGNQGRNLAFEGGVLYLNGGHFSTVGGNIIARSANVACFALHDNSAVSKGQFIWEGTGTNNITIQNLVSGAYVLLRADSYFVASGNAAKPGGGSWTDSSDVRVKNILGDYTSGLASIRALQPVRYTFKGNDTQDAPASHRAGVEDYATGGLVVPYPNSDHYAPAIAATEYVGLNAQTTELIMPEMVTKAKGYIDGTKVTDLRMLDTSPLVFALVNAIKELAAKVDSLEAQLSSRS